MPRLKLIIFRVLIGLSLLGGVIAYFALTPRSQPCWPKPDGYIPSALLMDDSTDASSREAAEVPKLSEPVTILFGGDVMIGRGVTRSLKASPDYQPLARLRGHRGVDLIHANLESAVSESHPEWPWKAYHFRSEPTLLKRALSMRGSLAEAPLVFSVANNHILDVGRAGLTETLSALSALPAYWAGAGENTDEAWRPALIDVRGQRVGVLAVTDHCGCLDMCGWLATESRAGVAYAYLSGGEWAPLLSATRRLRRRAEITIISLHTGPNYLDAPPDWQRALAHALVDAGASVVLMHSAHHVLPYERRGDSVIFYALGDLLHDYKKNAQYHSDEGATAVVSFSPDAPPEVKLRPHVIKRRVHYPLKLKGSRAQRVLRRLNTPLK